MLNTIRTRRWGITGKLIVPFVTIFVLAIALMGTMFIRSQSAALSRSLEKKAESLVRNLANALGDAFAVGEYDSIQQVLLGAKQSDEDVVYAIVVANDGRGVATTDPSLKNLMLNRSALEADALKTSNFTRRETGLPGVVEVAMPVKFNNNRLGVLRVGISTHHVRALARNATATMIGVGLLALVLGVGVYFYSAQRVARPLRQAVARLQELASGDADLTLRLPVASSDETGQLAQGLNRFLDNLHHLVQE
ncbi:MAG: HAMP domain-containing protein, partial [Candidatus Rokubacteria bacterium]|nr:HAMP domain-containing protein [Candidatus Rokubacteria bacterium]